MGFYDPIEKRRKVNRLGIIAFIIAVLFHGVALADGGKAVADHTGKEVRVPADPKRVVALAPSITEMVFALGREDRLAGVTRFSNYPEAAARLPRVGSYVYLDIEKIISLKPDLVIAIKDGNPLRTVRRIEKLGIPVFAIHPMEIDSVIGSIRDIGGLLGAEEKANRLISDMENRLSRIDRRIAAASERPSVFFQIGVSPIVSAGRGTFIHEMIEKAGGENVAGEFEGYPRFSTEEILSMAPDVMILTSMERRKVFDDVVRQWRRWEDLPAVRDERIHMVDSDLFDRPSPRLIDGLEALAALLHPGLFE